MKNTHSSSFAATKFRTNSYWLLAGIFVLIIGLLIAACKQESGIIYIERDGGNGGDGGDSSNPFLGVWAGDLYASGYAEYGSVPVEITVTEDKVTLEVMGMGGDGTYTWRRRVITLLFNDEEIGTGTLNKAGDEIDIEIYEESFGYVTGTLRHGSQTQGQNPFLGVWEGDLYASEYAEYGSVPVEITVTEDKVTLSVMGMGGDGTYTYKGNIITLYFNDDPIGTGTLNAAGNTVVLDLYEESFGSVRGTLTRKSQTQGQNPFLGVWEGEVYASEYAEYGSVPVVITVTKDKVTLEVMGMGGEGEYTYQGNIITLLFNGDPIGTGTLNAAGNTVTLNLYEESFGSVTGTLTRQGSGPVTPVGGTPGVGDFIIEDLEQTVGAVIPVTINPKEGKSNGQITIYYAGTAGTSYTKSKTVPGAVGTYTVTFDVAASGNWLAVTGLNAGTLTISKTPDPSITVTVSFQNAQDAVINLDDFVLTGSGEFSITVLETFSTYAWYINGVAAPPAQVTNGSKTITLRATGDYLNFGNNRLSVRVTDADGVVYSKTVVFTVE